jgi:hypothetical protein
MSPNDRIVTGRDQIDLTTCPNLLACCGLGSSLRLRQILSRAMKFHETER